MRLRRLSAMLMLAPVLIGTGGCYAYSSYVTDQPVPGSTLEVTLNDRGRVAMEHHVGPEILQLTGTVGGVTDSSFGLRVTRVIDISRRTTTWAGEQVQLQPQFVRQMRERRFSAGRTALFAGSVTAGIVAFVVTRSLLGGGFGDRSNPGGPGDPPDLLRWHP